MLVMVVGWIPGCDTFSTMNASWPLGGDQDNYQEIIKSTYYICKLSHPLLSIYQSLSFYPSLSFFIDLTLDESLSLSHIMFHSMLTAPLLDLGDNYGLGGYVDVGCLRYGFYPNNVAGAASDQGKFWAVYPDICG